mgnify:CR=1 FL=1
MGYDVPKKIINMRSKHVVKIPVVGTVAAIIDVIQLAVLIGSIVPVEKALKRTFDENGNRR